MVLMTKMGNDMDDWILKKLNKYLEGIKNL